MGRAKPTDWRVKRAKRPRKFHYRSGVDAPTKKRSGIFLKFFLKFFLSRVETFLRDVGGHTIYDSEGAKKQWAKESRQRSTPQR